MIFKQNWLYLCCNSASWTKIIQTWLERINVNFSKKKKKIIMPCRPESFPFICYKPFPWQCKRYRVRYRIRYFFPCRGHVFFLKFNLSDMLIKGNGPVFIKLVISGTCASDFWWSELGCRRSSTLWWSRLLAVVIASERELMLSMAVVVELQMVVVDVSCGLW